jgi:hypothetical protein
VAKNTKTVSTLPEMPNMTRTPPCPIKARSAVASNSKGRRSLPPRQPSGFAFPTSRYRGDTLPGKDHQRASLSHVHMIKLTETREITPYLWVHPDEGAVMAGSKKRPQPGAEAVSD